MDEHYRILVIFLRRTARARRAASRNTGIAGESAPARMRANHRIPAELKGWL
jgi:hypothetical protein